MTALLNALIDIVDSPLFIVGRDGAPILENVCGKRLLQTNREEVSSIFRTAVASSEDTDISTYSVGEMEAWRRWIVVDGQAYALVVIEVARSSFEAVLTRAIQSYALTTRQSDVFRLILEGASNKEIASRLRMAPRTVEVHLTAIFEKVGVESRARLIAKTWDSRRPGSLRP